MSLLQQVQQLAGQLEGELKEIRHHLHANPELSFEEHETAKFVQQKLTNWGIEFQAGVAETGVVGMIKGKNPDKKVVALRGDMDALPIQEENEVPYKSTKAGVMHACGHDVHTTSLLGAAKILHDTKEHWEGTVKLVFQPGEERIPGGASLMIKEGVLKNPEPKAMVGQHVMPFIPAGKVGFREGMYMASADEIYVTVKGRGGHGAMPERNIDPVMITAQMLVALQQVVSRYANPKIPSVLSFGKITANGATNVIPNEVKLEGTFRTMNEEWRAEAHQRMKKIAESIAEGMGGRCDFEIRKGYPFLENDGPTTQIARQAAQEYLGEENVVELDKWMAAEDFSYYSHEVPSCFYRLGTGNEELDTCHSVHTPNFNIDESALKIGAGLLAYIAVRQLQV
jgi:amidohydrolase